MKNATKTRQERRPEGSEFRASLCSADFAAKVANDIPEEIDCGESREELRAVIRWWADRAAEEALSRASAESNAKLLKAALWLGRDFGMEPRKTHIPEASALAGQMADTLLPNAPLSNGGQAHE